METPQQYSARILGNLEGKDPLKILSTTPQKIKKILGKLSKKAIYKKPSENKWSIAEIVAHLAETELVNGWRFRIIVEKNEVPIQPFEQDAWAKNSRYHSTDVKKMITLYAVLREANLQFIKGLPKEKFENFGMHAERGKESISHLINLEAGHDLNHLRQIEAIVSKKSKKKN
ncbi:MAG: DinB family protein [Bacteroidota bacterium]|nr:DinB family protein [Bacteroidota bacterium]